MTITINGDTGIAGVDGTASVPAVQGNDTNTGLFYPAADTVGVSTGGSERMRVDSSGNVGIGTSSPNNNGVGSTTLTINAAVPVYDLNVSGTRTSFLYASSSLAGTGTVTSLPFAILTANTERMRIDSSGNVGIGLTSLTEKFEVNGSVNASTASSASFSTGNQRAFMDYVPGSTTARFGHLSGASGSTTGVMAMFTNGTERMRIDSSGNVGIGTASPTTKLDVNGILKCLLTDSQTSNGYTKLPNGVYMQWGSAGASTSGVTTSFPIAFPTACWMIVGVNQNQTNPPAPSISFTRTNFTMTVLAGGPTVSWLAVGY